MNFRCGLVLGPNEGNILRGEPREEYILVATNLVGDVPANVYATNFQVEWLFYNVVIDPNQSKEGDPAPFTMGEAGVVQIFNTTESTWFLFRLMLLLIFS